jgi:hypothetical protein
VAVARSATDFSSDFDALVDGDAAVERHAVLARCRAAAPVFFSDRLGANACRQT